MPPQLSIKEGGALGLPPQAAGATLKPIFLVSTNINNSSKKHALSQSYGNRYVVEKKIFYLDLLRLDEQVYSVN